METLLIEAALTEAASRSIHYRIDWSNEIGSNQNAYWLDQIAKGRDVAGEFFFV